VIGLYFSADWCPPCQVFTPLLKQLHSSKRAHCSKANRNIPPFEVVLVLGCRDHTTTNHYFSAMPWMAMKHAEAVGKWRQDLQNRFGIRTTPALVLLDGEGAVLGRNVQWRLWEDPRGTNFPWQDPSVAPRLLQVGFDLGLPKGACLTSPLKRPLGKPPSLTLGKPTQAQNSQYVKEAAIAHRDRGLSLRHQRLGASSARMPENTTQDGSAAGVVPAEEVEDWGGAQGCRAPKKGQAKLTATQQLEIPQPEPAPTPGPTRQPTLAISMQNTKDPDNVPWPRPLPKPNMVDRASPSMLSRAVDALAALTATRKNNDFGSRWIAVARSDAQQDKTNSLMQPQPLLAVHPFTPTLNKWWHGIEVDCGPDWSWEVVEAATAHGPHPTATTPDSIALFKEDIEYQVKAGFCKVMLWEDLNRLHP
jgi:thiol-disulfide isomerase/thioredoxin